MINVATINNGMDPAFHASLQKSASERVVIGGLMKHLIDLAETNAVKAGRNGMTSQDLYTAAQVMSLPSTDNRDQLTSYTREYQSFFGTMTIAECFKEDYADKSTVEDNVLDARLKFVEKPDDFTHVPRSQWSGTELFNLGNALTLFRTSSHDKGSEQGLPSIMREITNTLAIVMEVPQESVKENSANAFLSQTDTQTADEPTAACTEDDK